MPFLKYFVRREFRKRDSSYQNYRHYDIYRFPRGAWSSLLLNTIYDRIERDQRRARDAAQEAPAEADTQAHAQNSAADLHDGGDEDSAPRHGNGVPQANGEGDPDAAAKTHAEPRPTDGGTYVETFRASAPAQHTLERDGPGETETPPAQSGSAIAGRKEVPKIGHNGGSDGPGTLRDT